MLSLKTTMRHQRPMMASEFQLGCRVLLLLWTPSPRISTSLSRIWDFSMSAVELEITSSHWRIKLLTVQVWNLILACSSRQRLSSKNLRMFVWNKAVHWSSTQLKANPSTSSSWPWSFITWRQSPTSTFSTVSPECWKRVESSGSKHAHLNSKWKASGGRWSSHKEHLAHPQSSQEFPFFKLSSRLPTWEWRPVTSQRNPSCRSTSTLIQMVLWLCSTETVTVPGHFLDQMSSKQALTGGKRRSPTKPPSPSFKKEKSRGKE